MLTSNLSELYRGAMNKDGWFYPGDRGIGGAGLPQIPRTGTGKIQRDRLKRAILDAMGSPASRHAT